MNGDLQSTTTCILEASMFSIHDGQFHQEFHLREEKMSFHNHYASHSIYMSRDKIPHHYIYLHMFAKKYLLVGDFWSVKFQVRK